MIVGSDIFFIKYFNIKIVREHIRLVKVEDQI